MALLIVLFSWCAVPPVQGLEALTDPTIYFRGESSWNDLLGSISFPLATLLMSVAAFMAGKIVPIVSAYSRNALIGLISFLVTFLLTFWIGYRPIKSVTHYRFLLAAVSKGSTITTTALAKVNNPRLLQGLFALNTVIHNHFDLILIEFLLIHGAVAIWGYQVWKNQKRKRKKPNNLMRNKTLK